MKVGTRSKYFLKDLFILNPRSTEKPNRYKKDNHSKALVKKLKGPRILESMSVILVTGNNAIDIAKPHPKGSPEPLKHSPIKVK